MTDNEGETIYYLTVEYKGKEVTAEVSKETYEKYNVCDAVSVMGKEFFWVLSHSIL